MGYPQPPAAPIPALPKESYTPWLNRVLAYIIDNIPVAIIVGIGSGTETATQETVCVTDSSGYEMGEFCDHPATPRWVLLRSCCRCLWRLRT